MNNFEMCRNWEVQKAILKQQFAELTDNDLAFEMGKKQEMLERLPNKIGRTREELHTIIAVIEISVQFNSVSRYQEQK